MLLHPIDPVFDENSEILILGSFPSVKSREQGFFYGHPQNRFWRVLAEVFREMDNASPTPESVVPAGIPEKKAFLLKNHVAVWDVIASCEITGSSDSSITDVTPNDITEVLEKAPIRMICTNGGKAHELYEKYIYPVTKRHALPLPSTSPANAAWSAEKLVCAWRKTLKLHFGAPEGTADTMVYLAGGHDESGDVWKRLSEDPDMKGRLPVLVSVPVPDWNRDMSPWPAQKVFSGGDDFSGGAEAFLKSFTEDFIPDTEALLIRAGILKKSPRRVLAGYSLAGLFAAWAPFQTDLFDRFASMSGSVWFDGFLDYASSTSYPKLPEKAYLSLGDKERKTKNPRMREVQNCTEAFRDLLLSRGIPVTYELKPGNHFVDVPVRIYKGIKEVLS